MFSLFVTASFLTTTGVYLALNYTKNIINYAIKFIDNRPGQGEIYKKRRDYYIKTKNKDIRLNYIKAPSFDINVAYFLDVENMITGLHHREEFLKNTQNLRKYILTTKGTGVVEDVYRTTNIKKDFLYGYVTSYTEEQLLVFKIPEGLIDLRKIFEEYEENFS